MSVVSNSFIICDLLLMQMINNYLSDLPSQKQVCIEILTEKIRTIVENVHIFMKMTNIGQFKKILMHKT